MFGRDLNAPGWADLSKTNGNVSGAPLSFNRRVTTGGVGVTAFASIFTGGGWGGLDGGLNAVSDVADNEQKIINTNGNGGMTIKTSASMIQFIVKVKSNPFEGLSTVNSLINTFSGEADKKIKEKEDEK